MIVLNFNTNSNLPYFHYDYQVFLNLLLKIVDVVTSNGTCNTAILYNTDIILSFFLSNMLYFQTLDNRSVKLS